MHVAALRLEQEQKASGRIEGNRAEGEMPVVRDVARGDLGPLGEVVEGGDQAFGIGGWVHGRRRRD